ncbi:RIP homotypic interaction motif-containing protein [Actinoplanes sp. NPDC049668]|uniref:RIP homotypic interaction motif-containing protein n=1 Tax=unclassified Actinoplanes TaxID=2626549 RepID=UPI0033B3EED4
MSEGFLILVAVTVWTVVVLARSWRARLGRPLTFLLLVLALPAAFTGGAVLRVFLLTGLAWHLLLSFPDEGARRPARARPYAGVVVSLAATGWLLITGGRSYWLPVVIALGVVLMLWCLHLWFRRRAQPSPAARPVWGSTATLRPAPAPVTPMATQPPAEPLRRLAANTTALGGSAVPRVPTRRSPAADSIAFDSLSTRPVARPTASSVTRADADFAAVPARMAPAPDAFAAPAGRARPRTAAPSRPILPVVLDVTAHTGAHIDPRGRRSAGLAWREHRLAVRDATAVVSGDDNRVDLKERYRIRRLEISLSDFTSGPLMRALNRLLHDAAGKAPSGAAIRDFQKALAEFLGPAGAEPSSLHQQINRPEHLRVVSCKGVQVGDHNRMTINDSFVLDRSQIPITGLLAEHRDYVTAFVTALQEPAPGPHTARFLTQTLNLAGRTDDLALIEAAAPGRPDTMIGHLFGTTAVTSAAVVMVGVDNELHQSLKLQRPGWNVATLETAIAGLRVAEVPTPVSPVTPVRVSPASPRLGLVYPPNPAAAPSMRTDIAGPGGW